VIDGQHHNPAASPPGMRPSTYYTGGWVGTRAGLDGYGKSHPTMIQFLVCPAHIKSLFWLYYSSLWI